MTEGMERLVRAMDEIRERRSEQTAEDTSPIPAGTPSEFARHIQGIVRERIIAPASLEDFATPADQKRAEMIKAWVVEAYNTHVRANPTYPKWPHAQFERDILKSFDKGFGYFVQVSVVNDREKLKIPDHRVTTGPSNNRKSELRVDRRKPEEIIPEAYERDGTDPIENYTFEKLGVFGIEFFKMLKTGLEKNVSRQDLLHLLTHVYAVSPRIFDFEKSVEPPYSIDAKTIMLVCRQYPAQALKRLNAYNGLGKDLISKYWGDPTPGAQTTGNKTWVASPTMIRHLIFSYPDTVKHGLEIADQRLEDIQREHPQIPGDVIVDICAQFAGNYERELQNIHEEVATALDLYQCTDLTCDSGSAEKGEHVFRYLQLESRLYQVVSRKGGKAFEVFRSAMETYEKIIAKAQEKNVTLSFGSKRRVMQLLMGQTSGKNVDKIIRREEIRTRREEKMLDKFFARAEKADPTWGVHYALWGAGETFEEKISSGEEVITDILRHYLGDNYTEALLDHQFETLSKYIVSGFPGRGPAVDRLKECLLISPASVKLYYEQLDAQGTLPWPEKDGVPIPEIAYDDSWQYESDGEEESA